MNNVINETWLSNQLAWLLDPKGSHGLGGDFAKKFFEKSLIKVPLKKELNFDTFEVSREFYLQVEALDKTRNDESARRIDIVCMDLSQNTVIVIENKYEGTNSINQLSEYMQIENLFPSCDFYYIYLDFYGNGVFESNVTNRDLVFENYNEVSWTNDILDIFEMSDINSYEVFKLYKIIKGQKNLEIDFSQVQLLEMSLKILQIFDKNLDKKSNWKIDDKNTIKNGWDFPIDINILDKNIQIIYGHKRINRVQISNVLSNKQVLLYLINILRNAFLNARGNAQGSDAIQVDKIVYESLIMELEDEQKKDILKKLGIIK